MHVIDIRDQLVRSTTVHQVSRKVTKFVTLHWNGPSTAEVNDDIAVFKADARYHVNTRGWDGIAYHYGVSRTTHAVYTLRDFMARLNHSGVPQGNSESLSVLTPIGEGDTFSDLMEENLRNLLDIIGLAPRYVLGHQEWPRATKCPGALIMRFLQRYRSEHSGAPFTGKTKWVANVRDEPSVLSYRVRTLPAGSTVRGTVVLGSPVKGDSQWIKLEGTTDYVHGSLF